MLFAMFVVFVAMLFTLAVAGVVVAYVAFVQRGRPVPRAQWLTDVLQRLERRWAVPAEPAESNQPDRRLHVRSGGIRRPSRR
jgi:hypothetical protein